MCAGVHCCKRTAALVHIQADFALLTLLVVVYLTSTQTVCPHRSFALANKGFSYYHAKDQTPAVAVHLMNLATSGMLARHKPLLEACRKQTGMAVCKLYKDPFQLWVRCSQTSADRTQALGIAG